MNAAIRRVASTGANLDICAINYRRPGIAVPALVLGTIRASIRCGLEVGIWGAARERKRTFGHGVLAKPRPAGRIHVLVTPVSGAASLAGPTHSVIAVQAARWYVLSCIRN